MKTNSELVAKWSEIVMEDGFTAIPNLLIDHLVDLHINPFELSVIIAIERHRFFRGNAWPSNQRIGDLLGYDPRSVSRVTSELHQRNLLNKIERQGRSNLYDLEPLVKELEHFKGKPHPNKVFVV